ncbi:MAG: mechanosensitive ion channel family protein [Tidjanibacter sp.]|nr:mechanosensitive ion channel family protein [Tidjanibacter sp.]
MMKKTLVILLLLVSMFGCKNPMEQPYVTSTGDTLDRAFLITDSRVGMVIKGMSVNRLRKVYGENNVKQLLQPEEQRDTINNRQIYFVYDNDRKLLFTALASDINGNEQLIEQIRIRDNRFRTVDNIGADSNIAEIIAANNDASVVMSEDDISLFVPDIDGYFKIDKQDVKGFNPRFISDIPLDSLNAEAYPQTLTINWFAQESNMLSAKFWRELLRQILTWTIVELPALVIMIIVFACLLKLLRFIINRLKQFTINKTLRDGEENAGETLKRIETIMGIVHGVCRILLWVIFLLIFLAKININIGPILASAGIVGLAVGFGAQELVRDFISGFFILLEDQLRTGDMAIINGQTGVVEKIELRTITLRDGSGVVHIFQNGKINSLSNMTKEWSAIVIEMGVAYKEDVDRVMAIMQKVGDELYADAEFGQHMLQTIEINGLDQFLDSSIIIKATLKTRPMKQWIIKREYQRRLKIAFDKENVEIPYPHISIYTGEDTKPFPIDMKNNKE